MSDSADPRDLDDLTQAQEELGRALGRARIGEDRALFDQVRELGERLAYLLSGLLRMTRMHSPDNRAFDQPVAELHRTLVRLHEILGPIHLVAVEDQVYVNDIRIRTGDKDSAIHELGNELERHNVGEVTFHEPLDDAGIRGLVGALGEDPAAEQPRTALTQTLEARGVNGLELHGRFRFRMAGGVASDITERQDLAPPGPGRHRRGVPEPLCRAGAQPAAPAAHRDRAARGGPRGRGALGRSPRGSALWPGTCSVSLSSRSSSAAPRVSRRT